MLLANLRPTAGQTPCSDTRCILPEHGTEGHVHIGPDFDDEAVRDEEAA